MPMHRSARPERRLRNRSVRAARVRATLHMLHTHGLSRSPQTVPINAEAADQTCWSAACAYARRREKRPYLVAGEPVNWRPLSYEPGDPASPGQAAEIGARPRVRPMCDPGQVDLPDFATCDDLVEKRKKHA